jgi:hypothetical protein
MVPHTPLTYIWGTFRVVLKAVCPLIGDRALIWVWVSCGKPIATVPETVADTFILPVAEAIEIGAIVLEPSSKTPPPTAIKLASLWRDVVILSLCNHTLLKI